MSRFLDVFGRDQIKVTLFDDFASDTAAAYRDVLNFLDVDESFEPDFAIANAAKTTRHPPLRRIVKRFPVLKKVVRLMPNRVIDLGSRAIALVVRWKRRPEISPEFRKSLSDEFLPDIDRLEDLLDRSLDAWRA